jgi:hypothetical protein
MANCRLPIIVEHAGLVMDRLLMKYSWMLVRPRDFQLNFQFHTRYLWHPFRAVLAKELSFWWHCLWIIQRAHTYVSKLSLCRFLIPLIDHAISIKKGRTYSILENEASAIVTELSMKQCSGTIVSIVLFWLSGCVAERRPWDFGRQAIISPKGFLW